MVHIQFQICSLIIVTLIFVIYATHKRLMLRSERVFYRSLYLTFIMLVLDIGAISAMDPASNVPEWGVKFICKAYEASLIFCSGTVLIYLMADLLKKEEYKRLNIITLVILLMECFFACLLPIKISPNGYAYGDAVDMEYVIFAINFAITLFFLFKNISKITRRRRFGIGLWLVVWIILASVQMYDPETLLTSLAVSLGIIILFALLEKPEARLDKQYGCFNYFALINFLDEMVENNTPFSLVSVALKTAGTLTGKALGEKANHVLRVLERHSGLWIFRGINQDFICIAKNKDEIKAVSKDLENEAILYPHAACYARIIRCYETSKFTSANEILQFINYAKKKDNEQAIIFDATYDLMQAYHNRKQVEIDLRNALIEDRLEAFFQPIYSIHEKRITSCEALARIRTKEGKIIMPGDFIPIAEENGSILELGYKIFEQACKFIARHMDLLEYVEVNLSVVQCEDEKLPEKLISVMERYHIPPKKINLEITETASIVTKQRLLRNMQKLLDYGVTFSLDDFGKGESNLMYVVDMPISIVKLDFDMSKSYFKNEKAKYVVNAVEGMSHGLNLKLVAEGIESADELSAMEKQRIDYIQGFYFSKPLTQEDFVAYVQKYNSTVGC